MHCLWTGELPFGNYDWKTDFGVFLRMKKQFYEKMMKLGYMTGCHQMPERSFFFKGFQFPVCARCTGILIGQVIGFFLFPLLRLSFDSICFLFFLMFFDWWLQRLHLLESTNFRRVTSGLLCGVGMGQLFLGCICMVWRVFSA